MEGLAQGDGSMTSVLTRPASPVDERDRSTDDTDSTGDGPPSLPPYVPSPSGAVPRAGVPSLIIAAGVASLGAGAIHATAVGAHSEHRDAVIAFTIVAALQLCWGGLALVRSNRLIPLTGALISAGALAGWVVAKVSGISFVSGLDEAEPIQSADVVAAGLAMACLVLLGLFALSRRLRGAALPMPTSVMGVGVAGLAVFGMISAGTHEHESAGHGHDGIESSAPPTLIEPYDATLPVNLAGVAGVTVAQQEAAETVVTNTIQDLPQWADPAVALAAGFETIGDGGTGIEHFVNEEYMTDDAFLDPNRPESLVWDTTSGERRLVAAMYMADRGLPLEDVPDIGGNLMQWHVHDNLCYNAEGHVAGLTNSEGECPAGLVKPPETPMIHVWIEPHPCGPFAALEGIGGGRIPEGEEVLCDQVHGAPA